jgi:hypothetical protein
MKTLVPVHPPYSDAKIEGSCVQDRGLFFLDFLLITKESVTLSTTE